MADRNSEIILSKNIKLDRNYTNVLDYTNSEMLTLMQDTNHLVAKAMKYSFIRTTKSIKTHFTYEQCLTANYIAFQNPDYSNKWFFAWIDSVELKSDGCGEISFTIDEFTTWYKNLTLNTCMVVREHINTANDIPGANLVPESLDLGEFVVNTHLRDAFNRERPDNEGSPVYCIVVASTVDLYTLEDVVGSVYNGIPTGVKYFYFGIQPRSIEGESLVQDFIDAMNRLAGSSLFGGNPLDAIQQIFIAPYWILKNGTSDGIPESISPIKKSTGITPMSQLNGYTPTNKKLLTYPYCYINVSNGQGSDAILKQELWSKLTEVIQQEEFDVPVGDMVLEFWGALTPGCSIRAVPKNYDGDEVADLFGINLGKFPQINWNSDAFINWLTQNGVNIATSVGATAVGLATANPVMAGGGVAKGVDLLVGGVQASMTPPQNHGNINNGDIMTAADENCFHILKMSITSDYAERIDKYFSRYGYKTNKIKVPNTTGRTNFNYVQIADDDVIGYGEIPSKSLEQINNIFKNGVTIWHNHANIGNYNISNT